MDGMALTIAAVAKLAFKDCPWCRYDFMRVDDDSRLFVMYSLLLYPCLFLHSVASRAVFVNPHVCQFIGAVVQLRDILKILKRKDTAVPLKEFFIKCIEISRLAA